MNEEKSIIDNLDINNPDWLWIVVLFAMVFGFDSQTDNNESEINQV